MKRLAVLFVAVLVTACSSPYQQSSGIPSAPQNSAMRNGSSNPIKHVVVIMQENRSFDNLFHGFPKADTATSGYGHGVKYTLVSKPLKWTFDPNHYKYQFLEDYDGGKNDGWDKLIRGEVQSVAVHEVLVPMGQPARMLVDMDRENLSADGVLLRAEVRHSAVLDDGVAVHYRRSQLCVDERS